MHVGPRNIALFSALNMSASAMSVQNHVFCLSVFKLRLSTLSFFVLKATMLSPPLFCSIFLGLIFVNIFVIGNTKNKLTRSSSSTCTMCFQTEDDEEEFELFLQSSETLEESNAWAARPVEFSHDESGPCRTRWSG